MNHQYVVSELQQFQQSSLGKICPRCHQNQQEYLQLQCGHQFCIICIIYAYLKYKNQLKNHSQIECLNCHKISNLSQSSILIINQTIKKQIIPFVKKGQQYESRISPIQFAQKNQRKNVQSQNSSFISYQKLHNPKSNLIFSKSGSPNFNILQSSQHCKVHPSDQLQYVCMSCDTKQLCLKCITTKVHLFHDIKSIPKAYQILSQQINLLKINAIENIQNGELFLRRLSDRNSLLKQKHIKQMAQIKLIFDHLFKKISQKQMQITSKYQECFKIMFQKIELQMARANAFLTQIKQYKLILETGQKHTVNSNLKMLQVVSQYKNLKLWHQRLNNKDINPQILSKYQKMLDPINFHHESLTKSIGQLIDNITNIDSQKINQQFFRFFKNQNIIKNASSKNKTQSIRNCISRDKFKKDQFKRIKTNIASLNSSRQKKQKKCTRTQEDQRRLKSKANYKTETINSNKLKYHDLGSTLPTYIIKNLQKGKLISPFNLMTPCYVNSEIQEKSTSKILSKSNSNIVNQKRKKHAKQFKQAKQQVIAPPQSGSIKQRLQRKTINNLNNNYKTAKYVAESFKKKK